MFQIRLFLVGALVFFHAFSFAQRVTSADIYGYSDQGADGGFLGWVGLIIFGGLLVYMMMTDKVFRLGVIGYAFILVSIVLIGKFLGKEWLFVACIALIFACLIADQHIRGKSIDSSKSNFSSGSTDQTVKSTSSPNTAKQKADTEGELLQTVSLGRTRGWKWSNGGLIRKSDGKYFSPGVISEDSGGWYLIKTGKNDYYPVHMNDIE